MTVSLFLGSIASAIAGLTISGVTIKDYDEVVASWVSKPNVLYPLIDNWVTGYKLDYASFVQTAEGPMTISYTLHYRFLSTAVGDISTISVAYSQLVDKVIVIHNALLATRAPYDGRVLMTLGNVSMGPRDDPAGNQYFGADIELNIEELQN